MTVYSDLSDETLEVADLTVAVFGLGKMGLPLAAVLARERATVHGVDIDESVVETVNAGESPIANEPGLAPLLDQHGGAELTATTDGAAAAADADVMVILVPTIVDEDNDPILDPVAAAADDIAAGVEASDLVILESTVPPGTTVTFLTDAVTPDGDGPKPGDDFGVAYCPERTSAGRVIRDLTESYPKIVGGIDEPSTAAAAALYRSFNQPGVVEMDSATAAEAVKVFEGVYRDTNIALANELGVVCEELGLDSERIFDAANTQPYCDIHDPGIGVGGHCIPVYPHFVLDLTDSAPLIETARGVNDSMPGHAVDMLSSLLAGHGRDLEGTNVLVLGATYRPGVEETRFSPSLDVIDLLREAGASPYVHDPLIAPEHLESFGAMPVDDPLDAPALDGVVLATGHNAYEDLDLDALADAMRTPIVVDGRRFFDHNEMDAFTYAVIGDGTTGHARSRTNDPPEQ